MSITSNKSFDKNFILEVIKGKVPGHRYLHKFGAITAAGTTITPIALAGVYQTPSTLTSLEMVSSDNTNDKAGGTGALTVTVVGIGTGWTELSETVTLNGTTAVALNNQFYRVYRMYVATSGTYATSSAPSHNSTITLRVSGAGATWAQIVPDGSFGLGQTLIGAYTIPSGETGFFLGDHISVEANKTCNIYRFFRDSANDTTTPFSPIRVQDVSRVLASGEDHISLQGPYVGPCDFGYMGAATTGTANIEVDFEMLIVENAYL